MRTMDNYKTEFQFNHGEIIIIIEIFGRLSQQLRMHSKIEKHSNDKWIYTIFTLKVFYA